MLPWTLYRRLKSVLEPLRPIYNAWMTVIRAFSWVLVRILLTGLFFTVFLLYGVSLRLLRKDPMQRKIHTEELTYWDDSVVTNRSMNDFKKQY